MVGQAHPALDPVAGSQSLYAREHSD